MIRPFSTSSSTMSGTAALLTSNTLLSAYPILIKKYMDRFSVLEQTVIRTLVYTIFSLAMITPTAWPSLLYRVFTTPRYWFISAINLLHVYTSYIGFEQLPAGVAMTTFYMYPVLQVLLSHVFLRQPKQLTSTLALSLAGCMLAVAVLNGPETFALNVTTSSSDPNTTNTETMSSSSSSPDAPSQPSTNPTTPTSSSSSSLSSSSSSSTQTGLWAILAAALTEAIISVFYKDEPTPRHSPFEHVLTLYAPSLLLVPFLPFLSLFLYNGSGGALGGKGLSWGGTMGKDLWGPIAFNLVAGAVGYMLRLEAVQKLDMVWFSQLSFTTAITTFVLGWLFLGEAIQSHHVLGSAIMFVSILQYV